MRDPDMRDPQLDDALTDKAQLDDALTDKAQLDEGMPSTRSR